MSGPRPVHLSRRGAVYAVRFQIPLGLQDRLGIREIRRSLCTKDIDVARARCLDATRWFRELMERCAKMPEITKADVEREVRRHFEEYARYLDRREPIGIEGVSPDSWLAKNILDAEAVIRLHDTALKINRFSAEAIDLADQFTEGAPPDSALAVLAQQLVTRANRQAMRYWKHRMENPILPFVVDDPFFEPAATEANPAALFSTNLEQVDTQTPPLTAKDTQPDYPTLGQLTEMYAESLRQRGAGLSHRNEIGRCLEWLEEELGCDTSVDKITLADVRSFRNNIIRLDASKRGLSLPFHARLTDIDDHRIVHATASKYWGAVRGMFAWALSEGHCPDNPAANLRLERPIGEEASSPEAYSTDELIRFFRTPLYTGYKSTGRLKHQGDCYQRGQHWWAGVLPLFTGMRAGELSQLLPSDFFFDAPIPYLQITRFDEQGRKVKRAKTQSSVRRVPLAPTLLTLGVRQFVERRKKIAPRSRVFDQFRMGELLPV